MVGNTSGIMGNCGGRFCLIMKEKDKVKGSCKQIKASRLTSAGNQNKKLFGKLYYKTVINIMQENTPQCNADQSLPHRVPLNISLSLIDHDCYLITCNQSNSHSGHIISLQENAKKVISTCLQGSPHRNRTTTSRNLTTNC